MYRNTLYVVALIPFLFTACRSDRQMPLHHGLQITRSVTIAQDTFHLNGSDSLQQPVITIEGEHIEVDFNGAVLIGSNDKKQPDQFYGTAIAVKGRNITIKNLSIKGYKVAILATNADSLRILDCDLSYNYRPQLKSTREREDFSDWLSYHQNDKDEWLRYGAALYLKNCNHAFVRNLTVTNGQNGLMLSGCNDGLFYNNTIQFNSGVGIGLYRSSRNRIMHNRLDWNVRGYSHGIYQRGQDSAALLVYEQSNDNTFAFNSATHSGDGFFLWAGQTTMDTGEGGCNGNLLYQNDFSYAPTNGIEVTFSSNTIVQNKITECRYGIWGGYSYDTHISENLIDSCETGIAIEHGQQNAITGNTIRKGKTGIRLWERSSQPSDWGYAANKNVNSRDYEIRKNTFTGMETPLRISDTENILITADNHFDQFATLLLEERPNTGLEMNVMPADSPSDPALLPDRLPDGMDTGFSPDALTGRAYILMDEWGPYDFRSPSIWLRNIEDDRYTFLLLGPPTGNYRIIDGKGWSKLSRVSGSFPATLVATKKQDAERLTLELEFIGEAFTDRFGEAHKKGEVYPFRFDRFEKNLPWEVNFYAYDDQSDPLTNYNAFSRLASQKPLLTEQKKDLYYAWWGSPGPNLPEDRFATFSSTHFSIEPGNYRIQLTSDDGARLFLDDVLLIDHWDIHEPATDERTVSLGGTHHIRIEHFEAGGFATLDCRLIPAN